MVFNINADLRWIMLPTWLHFVEVLVPKTYLGNGLGRFGRAQGRLMVSKGNWQLLDAGHGNRNCLSPTRNEQANFRLRYFGAFTRFWASLRAYRCRLLMLLYFPCKKIASSIISATVGVISPSNKAFATEFSGWPRCGPCRYVPLTFACVKWTPSIATSVHSDLL